METVDTIAASLSINHWRIIPNSIHIPIPSCDGLASVMNSVASSMQANKYKAIRKREREL